MIANLQDIVRQKTALVTLLIGVLALIVIGIAWIFQIAGYLPCQLCLWQRIPYYLAIPLLMATALIALNDRLGQQALKVALLCAGLLFVGGAFLAIYHSGVEWGFWAGPTSCGAAGGYSEVDASDLLAAISKIRPPSCNEAAGRFIGLSFAGWNVVASVGLAIACFFAARAASNEPTGKK